MTSVLHRGTPYPLSVVPQRQAWAGVTPSTHKDFPGSTGLTVAPKEVKVDDAGNQFTAYAYDTGLKHYENFGTEQGWSPHNGFDITFLSSTDTYASVLGFGNDGIVVAPQAFSPGATAADSYTVQLVGNNVGWDQTGVFEPSSTITATPLI